MLCIDKAIYSYFGEVVVGIKLENLPSLGFMFNKSERKTGQSYKEKSSLQFDKTAPFLPGLEESKNVAFSVVTSW